MITIVVPVVFMDLANLLIFSQFTFRILPVVAPNSFPCCITDINSLLSNKLSGKCGSVPDRVS